MSNNRTKYGFFEMLRVFGIGKLFFCIEFYLSLLIPTMLFYSMFYISESSIKTLIVDVSKVLLAADVAMLAIVISGFAIVLSVSGSNFLYFLNRRDLNIRFFFPFYLSSVLWGWHSVLSIAIFLLSSTFIDSVIFIKFLCILFYFYIFFFLYALLNSVSLVRAILRLSFEKVRLDETLGNIDERLKGKDSNEA